MISPRLRFTIPSFFVRSLGLASATLLVLSACSTRLPAPIEDRPIQTPPPRRSAVPPVVAPKPPPAVADTEARPQTYTVKRGDTLYLIALDHGLDYRELAAWNNIENVNVIRVGQVLRLTAPAESAPSTAVASGVTTAPLRSVPPVTPGAAAGAAPPGAPATSPSPAASTEKAPAVGSSRNSETYKTQPKASKEPYSERALRDMQQRMQSASATPPPVVSAPAPAIPPPPTAAPPAAQAPVPAPEVASSGTKPPSSPPVVARAEPKLESKASPPAAADDDDKLDWVWPASGKLVTGFSDNANLKGIDIAGKAGQPVLASAGGKVVYAGTGLRGYGKLIIIKHTNNYLSAYAHNKDILVKEGQQVQAGQKIAEMGSTDADQVKLHFEIRRLGKPMDPLKYLPPA